MKLTNWRQFLCVCPLIDDKLRYNIVKVLWMHEPQASGSTTLYVSYPSLLLFTIKINQSARENSLIYSKMFV